MRLWRDVGEAMQDAMSKRWGSVEIVGDWSHEEWEAICEAACDLAHGRFGHTDLFVAARHEAPEWMQ